jgi:hypothetical protein
MADRLEYQGNPLPPGLPGIGGSTVTSLNFPQQGAYFPPIVNGPVVDIPVNSTSQPPSPTAPVGNDPANPTTNVAAPAQAPAQSGASSNFLKKRGEVCDQLGGFIAQFSACSDLFNDFYVCEDGEPKKYWFISISDENLSRYLSGV